MIDTSADYTPYLIALTVLATIGVFTLVVIAVMIADAIRLLSRPRKPTRQNDNPDRADWWRDN